MPNDYYERKAELEPFTTARSDDVRNELDAVQSAFEKLAKPRQDGTKGFLTAFTVVTPTNPNEPATHAQVIAEKEKNTEQDGRLDNVENALSGIGSVEQRYTTLRYVASEGQTQIVLPAQFQSLAYVHKNGARLYQAVGFDYDVATKTITFANSLSLSDEVLVDVGMVPDAVLADLIAIQNDIANRHSDINTKHQDVTSKHQSVSSMHGDVDAWQQQVATDRAEVQRIESEFGDLEKLKSDIQASEATAVNGANIATTKAGEAHSSASSARLDADRAEAAASLVGDIKYAGSIMYATNIIDRNQVIPPNQNAQLIGPSIRIADGITVTVGDNSTLTVR